MKKSLSIILIILMMSSFILFYQEGISNASYSDKFANYPRYDELIADLQKDHPNWEFEIVETNLDWSQALNAESVGNHGRSLISKYDGAFDKCATCGNKEYEPGWYCASGTAVAYYLDPRNSLCEDYIFQFEQLTYDKTIQTKAGVEKILADCNYMQGTIKYKDTSGKTQTINKTYIDVIMDAAATYNVSPYHIASRIRQEMGTGSGSVIISGTYGGYVGYYNYFNYGAFGNDIIGNGLATAKSYGWDNPEKAIKGGVELLAKNYIAVGQDTLYFQKFNVVNKNSGYYIHQYMTNVSASKSEGLTVKKAYTNIGMLSKDTKIKFKIPVYKNMPTAKCPAPGKETIVTQDVKLTANTSIRLTASIDGQVIAELNKDEKIIRIELATSKDSTNNYWDKVVLGDGSKGYAPRSSISQISSQSNCNEKYVVINQVEMRNGPGTVGTEIVRYVSAGQMVTAVEKDKYPNLDGENWYRIKLSDGDVGYVAIGSVENPNMLLYDETNPNYGYVKVICTDGLRVRSEPNTSSTALTSLYKDAIIFRIAKDVSNNGGYIWDKIVTDNGTVGYVVRQDKTNGELWIKPYSGNYSVDDTTLKITCVPNVVGTKLGSISAEIVIKNGETVIDNSSPIATGYTIIANGKTYTAVVKGDVTGTGTVTAVDAARTLKKAAGKYDLKDAYLLAADVTGDGKVTAVDAARILKAAAGKYTLSVL